MPRRLHARAGDRHPALGRGLERRRGRTQRGALWTYLRGEDRSDGTCAPGNGIDEIHAEDADWFADHDAAGALATTMNDDVSVSAEVDLVFDTERAADWTVAKPGSAEEGQISLPMVALHEFGHGLGFNHDDASVAVMNPSYPNGGELGGEVHPHADDHAGLVASRPDASAGTNLLLGKFVADPADPGDSLEVWDEADDRWTVCAEELDARDGPEAIVGVVHETGGPERPIVVWQLSSDGRCFTGAEVEVGRAEPELSTGLPVLLRPDAWDFRAVPAGEYRLCARIDADEAIVETRESDNSVRSEARLTVQDCR